MKTPLLLLTILASGCAHHAYKPQKVTTRGNHTLIIHESRTAMENAYEYDIMVSGTKGLERGKYGGYYSPRTNTSHCFQPWPEQCMLHEYKHLLVKYGLVVPDDPHFKRKNTKIRIIKRRYTNE